MLLSHTCAEKLLMGNKYSSYTASEFIPASSASVGESEGYREESAIRRSVQTKQGGAGPDPCTAVLTATPCHGSTKGPVDIWALGIVCCPQTPGS